MANGNLYYWVANWNLSRSQAALLLRGEVADLVDCIHADVAQARDKYVAEGVKRFGAYATGSADIRWTPEDYASFPHGVVFWTIDQSNLDLPILSNAKKVVDDQEPGAKTVPQTVTVAKQRIPHGDDLIVYVDQSGLPEVEDAMHVEGYRGQIIAYQYKSTDIGDLSVVSTQKMPLALPPTVKQDARRAQITVTDDVDQGWSVDVRPIAAGAD